MFLLLVMMAFISEFVDASMGMGYGTILAPVLILMGIPPLIAVPSVLLSQAFGGGVAAIFHHKFRNADFDIKSPDTKVAMVIVSLGIISTILAACIAINIPSIYVKAYIGILVTVMGIIISSNRKFTFSWKKILGIGVLSSFNKAISGGGFGPVVTAGQMISGQDSKKSIAITTLTEVPICLIAFVVYCIGLMVKETGMNILHMSVPEFFSVLFSGAIFSWELTLALILGSILVAPLGSLTTKIIRTERLSRIVGIIVIILGVLMLVKVFV